MTFDKRHNNIIFSVIVFISISLILVKANWDIDFAAAGLMFATDIVAIGVGLLFILLKILKIKVNKTNFLYSYFGVLNLLLGIITFMYNSFL